MSKFLCKYFDKNLKKTDKTKIYRNLNQRQVEKIVSTQLLSEEHPRIDIYEFTDIFNSSTHKFLVTKSINKE